MVYGYLLSGFDHLTNLVVRLSQQPLTRNSANMSQWLIEEVDISYCMLAFVL